MHKVSWKASGLKSYSDTVLKPQLFQWQRGDKLYYVTWNQITKKLLEIYQK